MILMWPVMLFCYNYIYRLCSGSAGFPSLTYHVPSSGHSLCSPLFASSRRLLCWAPEHEDMADPKSREPETP